MARRTVRAIEGFLAEVRANTAQLDSLGETVTSHGESIGSLGEALTDLRKSNDEGHEKLGKAVAELKAGQDEIQADLKAHSGERAHPEQLEWNRQHEAEHSRGPRP